MSRLVAHEPQSGYAQETALLTVRDSIVGDVGRLLQDTGLWVEQRHSDAKKLTSFLIHGACMDYDRGYDDILCDGSLYPLMDYLFEEDDGEDYIRLTEFSLAFNEGRTVLGSRISPVVQTVSVVQFIDESDTDDMRMRAGIWHRYGEVGL